MANEINNEIKARVLRELAIKLSENGKDIISADELFEMSDKLFHEE